MALSVWVSLLTLGPQNTNWVWSILQQGHSEVNRDVFGGWGLVLLMHELANHRRSCISTTICMCLLTPTPTPTPTHTHARTQHHTNYRQYQTTHPGVVSQQLTCLSIKLSLLHQPVAQAHHKCTVDLTNVQLRVDADYVHTNACMYVGVKVNGRVCRRVENYGGMEGGRGGKIRDIDKDREREHMQAVQAQ